MTGYPALDDPKLEERIVRAIHEHRLADEARRLAADDDPKLRAMGAALVQTLTRIARSVDIDQILSELVASGVTILEIRRPELAQRHDVRARIARQQAGEALEALARAGFHPHPRWHRGALRSYLATSGEISVASTTDWTTVVKLELDQRSDHRTGHLARLTTPRPADWAAIDLPTWASPGYRIVRPVRLALERTGLLRRDHGALEPFLATPCSLVEPLLDLADVGPNDLVADLGCGDGRIIVEAAHRRGCRGLGAEYSTDLAETARRRAIEYGVADRVRIVTGDANTVDLATVDAVFLFLPIHLATTMVGKLRHRLRPGARIVVHEQNRPPETFPTPDVTTPIISADAVTVAHLWTV